MKREVFAELLKSVEQALEHAQGKRELRTTVLPAVPSPVTGAQVRRIRQRLNASQAVFARYLNVSTKLVQAWEAERRSPDGPALVLLRLAERDPEALAAAAFGVPLQELWNMSLRRNAKRRRGLASRGAAVRNARSIAEVDSQRAIVRPGRRRRDAAAFPIGARRPGALKRFLTERD